MVSHFRIRFSGDAGRDGRDAQTVPQPLVSRRRAASMTARTARQPVMLTQGRRRTLKPACWPGCWRLDIPPASGSRTLAVQRSVTNRPWRSGAQALALSGGEC